MVDTRLQPGFFSATSKSSVIESIEEVSAESPEVEVPTETNTKDIRVEDTNLPEHMLVVAPYTEFAHQLDLTTVDETSRLFALALTSLDSAISTYATASYTDALNWPVVFERLRDLVRHSHHTWKQTSFYVVEFRSQLKPVIDNPLLFKLDKDSHAEATASGGLLKYWYGVPDPDRRNLATCLWSSQDDALAGGRGPQHLKARMVIAQMYDSITIKGLRLTIEDDVSDWRFEPWSK